LIFTSGAAGNPAQAQFFAIDGYRRWGFRDFHLAWRRFSGGIHRVVPYWFTGDGQMGV